MEDTFKWMTKMIKGLEAISYGGCLVWKIKQNERLYHGSYIRLTRNSRMHNFDLWV